MADNIPVNPGQSENAREVATDEIGGAHFQRVKIDVGAEGASSPLVRGAQAAADSLPVVLASDQALPLPSGAATETTLDTRLSETTFDAKTGAVDETAPASDTASSGLNGRLQRIAQRLTSLIAVFAIGHGTAAAAVRVELPTDGTGVVGLNGGTNTIGKTYRAFQIAKALTNASVSVSSSGDNTVVSGTSSQTVRVHKLVLIAAGAVSVTLKDGAGTSLTGAIPLTTNGSLSIDFPEGEPAFVTSAGNGFVVGLSAAVAVTGFVQYTKS